MNEAQLTRTITFKGTSEGLDKLAAELNKVASATENVAVVTEKSAGRIRSVEDAYKRQTLKLDEAARAQNMIARETRLADAALREQIINQDQHAQRLQLIQQRYGTVTEATQKFGQQTGLARHELINLGRQAQDVGVSLMSGQSPLTVLAQQGSQIADVFIASGKSVGDFFKQAVAWATPFVTSTAGIVAGIGAIGAAATYAAVQFTRASTTVEQALENQNRLLKEGKALIDARTSAETRAQANPRDLTEFEIKRNLLDLQRKLNEEARGALIRSVPSSPGIGDIRGEFSADVPAQTPGMDKLIDAAIKLKAARAAGLPGLKEFNAELGRIGTAHPELAKTVDKMIELGRTGIELENAEMRLRAISDALKGIATDAQMAAVGLGSVAQFQLNNRMAEEAKAATERQAQAVLQMAQTYPGISIEVAKTLAGLQGQLSVAQAVGASAQMEAQHRATINQLLLEGKTLTEATAVADAQRAVALAQIASQHQVTMVSLQGQLSVAQEITGLGRINAEYYANINNLLMQGLSLTQATAQAEMQRSIALAQVNAQADQKLKSLQQEGELLRAGSEWERDRIRARQEYNKLIEEGVDSLKAQAIAAQMIANADQRDYDRELAKMQAQSSATKENTRATDDATDATKSWSVQMDEANDAINSVSAAMERQAKIARAAAAAYAENVRLYNSLRFVPTSTAAYGGLSQLYQSPQGGYSQFDPAGYTSTTQMGAASIPGMKASLDAMYGSGNYDPMTGLPNAQGKMNVFTNQFNKALTASGGNLSQGIGSLISKPGSLFTGGEEDTGKLSLLRRGIDLMSPEEQKSTLQSLIDDLKEAPQSLQTAEINKQLNDQLQQLVRATDENTDATQSMTDVLSPFYSSDPRRTHLGFRAFAGGGIMSSIGELPMMSSSTHAAGGIASTPQAAMFGEGSVPEAYVPVPSGRIPVEIKVPANSNQRPVHVTINVMGNADAGTVAALKQTTFQKSQQLRRITG